GGGAARPITDEGRKHTMKTRLLVIDPMPLARKAVTDALRGSETVEVIGAVSGPGPAQRRLPTARPDVLLVDVEPPVEAEAEALRRLRELCPVPVVLFTALEGPDREAVIAALPVPRSAVLGKPATNLAGRTAAMAGEIEAAVRRAHRDERLRWHKKKREP